MAAPATGLTLRLAGLRSSLEPARQAVLAYLAAWPLSERVLYRIELVLEEILLNVALHAGPAPAGGWEVQLGVEVGAEQVLLRFAAQGPRFNPLLALERSLPNTLDEAIPGGLGLRLVRRNALTMAYERQDDRNVLRVVLARHAGAEP